MPNKIVLLRPTEEESPNIVRIAKFTKSLLGIDGKATAYVCQNYACNLPTTEIDTMLKQLAAKPSGD